jgi:hypothetical protein
MANPINDISNDKKIVEDYLNIKIYAHICLFVCLIGLILTIFYFKWWNEVPGILAFYEIGSLDTNFQNLISHYSLESFIALFITIIGFFLGYLYFWHTAIYIWNDPEKKDRKVIAAFNLINSQLFQFFWLIVFFGYLFYVKKGIFELFVVLILFLVCAFFGFFILLSYEKIIKKFDALEFLFYFINYPEKETNLTPFYGAKWFYNFYDIRKKSIDLTFLMTFIVLLFGLIFSFIVKN